MLVYGMITKGNGDVILSPERHTSLSTGGGQAGQGYPCVLEPIVVRDEMTIKVDTNGKVFTLRGRDHKSVQCVVTEDEDVVRG